MHLRPPFLLPKLTCVRNCVKHPNLLAQMDAYSIAMEACYDSILGPLELAPFAKQAAALSTHMADLRRAAEDDVRGDEFAYEDLLASDYWGHIEALRVAAAAYAQAWGQLAVAVRHISVMIKKEPEGGAGSAATINL